MSSEDCYNIVEPLYDEVISSLQVRANLTSENIYSLMNCCAKTRLFEVGNTYSKPMVWIGIYIVIASFYCIVAMAADLFHGFRNRKIWFPCKYFTLNAASITVITVAMKLPVDLTSLMPGYLDQATKLGSIAFMCTMMANLMPSLACMNNKTLLANVIGLAILIITMIVNICIEISTGVIVNTNFSRSTTNYYIMNFMIFAYIYIVMTLWLLMILISSAITIPASKQILEFLFQALSKRTSNDQDNKMSTVEKLRQFVKRYWFMAESGSLEFVMASNPLSFASGIICVISLVMHIVMMLHLRRPFIRYQSDYKWSMTFIAITQSIGIVVGSIAPILRCFTVLSFKSFTKWNTNHFMVFKVEKYWIQKMCEWKEESHIPFLSSSSRSRTLIHNLKNLFLSLCIRVQKVIVVSCKMMRLIVLVILISAMYCWRSLISMFFTPPAASRIDDINEDLRNYVLQLEDEMELAERTLKRISNSMNHLIQKAEKEQHKNLLMLLEISTGFNGVENFDINQVQPLIDVKLVNSWSLPIVTFTCIAIALPNIRKDLVDNLFKSVGEGLFYTHLVEESLNTTSEYGNIQRATMSLWHEVTDKCMWLENTLKKRAYQGKTSMEILKWFADKAEEIVIQVGGGTNGELMENTRKKLILANSMYRITQTILYNYQSNVEPISEEELFELLSSMIADILSACLTNIPRIIIMKCSESTIEKREESVEAAAKLLGRSTEIIKRLKKLEAPDMDHDKMAFVDEWHLHLKQSIP